MIVAVGAAAAELSIEDALSRALDASESVQIGEDNVAAARGKVLSAQAAYLPSVVGQVSYQHTFASEFDDLFPSTGGPSPFGELPFGRDDTWRVDFNASQPIWSGSKLLAENRVAAAQRRSAEVGLLGVRATAALDAAAAYFDAALADRLLEIASGVLEQVEATLKNVELGHEVGRQPEFALLRARVEVENQRVAVIRARRMQQVAHLRLAQALDLPAESLVLTTALDGEQLVDVSPLVVDLVGVDPAATRTAVRQAEEGLQLSKASLLLVRSRVIPTVAATASYGFVGYPDDAAPPPLADWRNNFTVGASLSMPLFSARLPGENMAAVALRDVASAQLEQVGELALLDEQDAQTSLEASAAQWEATAGTVEQARRAYAIAEVRHAEGVSTQTELADARLLLQQALANRAQAARDLQTARVRVALLPALPLGPTR